MGINDNLDKKTVIEDELSKVSGGAKQEVIKQYNIEMPNTNMPKNPVVAPKNKPGDNTDFGCIWQLLAITGKGIGAMGSNDNFDKKTLLEKELMKVAGGTSDALPVINYDDVKDKIGDPYSFTKGQKGGNENYSNKP